MLALYPPTLESVARGLITVIATDVALTTNSLILSLLPTGVTFDATTASTDDPGEFAQLKFGDSQSLPPGLSFHAIPGDAPAPLKWESGPGQQRQEYGVMCRWYYDDPDSGTQLTRQRGKLWTMMTALADATQVLLGPKHLGATLGFWSVGGGSIGNPRVEISRPCGGFRKEEHREQLILFAECRWRGFKLIDAP